MEPLGRMTMATTTEATQAQEPQRTPETVEARIARLGITEISEKRLASLAKAHGVGVSDETFRVLGEALRVSERDAVLIPCHRFENLSRGRGWARKGSGDNAEWGEREKGGYRVGPGRWTVGGSDGFSRKGSDSWTVEHVQVGAETWTVAS